MGRLHNWFGKLKKKPLDAQDASASFLRPKPEETEEENFFDLIEKALTDAKQTEEEMLTEAVPIEPESQPEATEGLKEVSPLPDLESEADAVYAVPDADPADNMPILDEPMDGMPAKPVSPPEFSDTDPSSRLTHVTPNMYTPGEETSEETAWNHEAEEDPHIDPLFMEDDLLADDPGIEHTHMEEAEEPLIEETVAFDTDSLDTTAVREAVAAIEGADFSDYAPKSTPPLGKTEEKTFVDLDRIEEHSAKESTPHDRNHRLNHLKTRIFAFVKKHKIASISTGVVFGVVALILALTLIFQATLDPLRNYNQLAAAKGNVIQTLTASGSVTPVERYEITSLVTGEITECNYEVGDTVKAGDVLYKFDDTDAQLSVQLAENEINKAKSQTEAAEAELDNLKIYAPAAGTIENLSISTGSAVRGGQICQIRIDDENVIPVVPNITGTVKSLSVREGAAVKSGALIATLNSSSLSAAQKEHQIDEQSGELSLKAAQKFLDNHSIKSPIDGVIVSKEAKVGDNITAVNEQSPMMVISNTSSMKFNIEIDETEIWDMQIGQTVVVSATAIPGETFGGEVTKIANEGNVKGQGITTFDVEITIKDPGQLKSGMSVSARVIQDSVTGVITLPAEALLEPDGKNALVIVKDQPPAEDEYIEEDMQDEDDKVEASLFPWIDVPKGCSLVTVKYGITDGTNVEILSGIEEGDIVCYLPQDSGYVMEPVEPATTQNKTQTADPDQEDDTQSAEEQENEDNEAKTTTRPAARPTSTKSTGSSRSTASPDSRQGNDSLPLGDDDTPFSQGGGMIL